MSQFDDIFKERLQKSLLVLIEQVLGEKFTQLEPQNTELRKQIKRKADFVFLAEQNRKSLILHLEVQTQDDKNMLERMYLYSALLYNRHRLPVKQIVLFLGKDETRRSLMVPEADMGYFPYRYQLLNIHDIPYREFMQHKETLVFAILGNFNGQQNVEVIREIMQKTRDFLRSREEFEEFTADLLTLSDLRNLDSDIEIQIPVFMPLKDLDFRKTKTYRKVKKEGMEEGKLEGKLEEKIQIAKAMLEDGLPTEQIVRYTQLSPEQIEELKKEIEKPE
jgi:predicted transposase YdaD